MDSQLDPESIKTLTDAIEAMKKQENNPDQTQILVNLFRLLLAESIKETQTTVH